MSTKTKPKPRLMWAQPNDIGPYSVEAYDRRQGNGSIRVAIIPLDDVEAIVERANKAHHAAFDNWISSGLDETWHPLRAALTAAGIPCKQRRARK